MPENNQRKRNMLLLLNDTDPVLLRVLRNKFQKDAGWSSVITTTFSEAIKTLKEKNIDAVITEIVITDNSGKTGFDLVCEAKKILSDPRKPIIVFSDLGQSEDKQKAMSLGANHYFVKTEISVVDLIKNLQVIFKG